MRLPLQISDTEFGHKDLGFIKRIPDEDPDDENIRFIKFLKDKGYTTVKLNQDDTVEVS